MSYFQQPTTPSSSDASRKRPRSTSPVPPRSKKAASSSAFPDSQAVAAQLLSKDDAQVVTALNRLLKMSCGQFSNFTNLGEGGEDLIQATVEVAYRRLGSKRPADYESNLSLDPTNVWSKAPAQQWLDYCQDLFQHTPIRDETLQVVLMIWRNLSYVTANLRLMSSNVDLLYILIASLFEHHDGTEDLTSASASLSASALVCLTNLAAHLDVTGQKLLCDKYFINLATLDGDNQFLFPASQEYGLAMSNLGYGGPWLAKRLLDPKEADYLALPQQVVLNVTRAHLTAVWSIFAGIHHVLTDTKSPRCNLLSSLDLLREFLDQVGLAQDAQGIPSIRRILQQVPTAVLMRLQDLLWIPRLSPDACDYVNPVCSIVSRVAPLKLLMGYDATVDTDLRDRALDVLVPLCELDSPALAQRLGSLSDNNESTTVNTRLWDTLVPILTTKAGRHEASHLACQLVRLLAKAKENQQGLAYIQQRLLALACKDARVAQLALTLYNNDGSASEQDGSDDSDKDDESKQESE